MWLIAHVNSWQQVPLKFQTQERKKNENDIE